MEDLLLVVVVDANGVKSERQLSWRDIGEEYVITLCEPGSERTWSARGTDLFDAFYELRRQLEPTGIRFCVSGARTDAHPSGLLRSASDGQMVYLLRRHGVLARSLRLPSLRKGKAVYLFSPAPCDLVGSVDEQENYFEEWCNYKV